MRYHVTLFVRLDVRVRVPDHFAGLYHPPGSNSLTYGDIINELCLCFNITASGVTDDSWGDVAFGYLGSVGASLQPLGGPATIATPSSPRLIHGQELDQSVSTPPGDPSGEQRPPIVRLHVVRHKDCEIAAETSLKGHLQAGCAKHIPYPSLRRDDRYLPPNKPSTDSRFSRFPYRKTIRARGSQSPPKRSASGSASPTKDPALNQVEDVTDLVAPPDFDIPIETARQTMASFRNSCLSGTARCAITGKGRSWYMNPTVGLGVQACHIVPQQHYHVYPVPSSFPGGRYDSRRLRAAWERTWSAKNGLLLFSHLHELFDARLFSIHPDTLRIRVFMPYYVLLDYHGVLAHLSSPDDSGATGDPSKRHRRDPDRPIDVTEALELSTGHSSTSSSVQYWSGSPLMTSQDGYSSTEAEAPHRDKRRRIADSGKAVLCDDEGQALYHSTTVLWEGSITPWNSHQFLADVNYELLNFKHSCSS
ncbi:HNHc domain-containing protein [Fusarium sp. Ph1]|nr:HNHc domain-containing protein [Fusarium sp. Ph1]